MKALLVCGAAVVVGLALAEPGRACSRPVALTPTEPRAVIAEADAAFIGTLVAVTPKEPRSLSSAAPYVFTFAVEEQFKGELGNRVEVTSTRDGGTCGLDATIGRRGAFVLLRRDDVWGPWGTTEVSVDTLRRGVLPLPKPDGVGPPAFVAGGRFGLVRSAILDARGRTLRYGVGAGAVTALSVCPGRKVVVELVWVGESVRMALRALPSLRVLRETEIRDAGYGETVACRSRTGSDVIAVVQVREQPEWETQLLRISPVGKRVLERAPQLAAAVYGKRVYVSATDGRFVMRDLEKGTRRAVFRTAQLVRGMSISPDGRLAAGFMGERLVLADLLRGTTKARLWSGHASQTRWTGQTGFAAWSRGSGRLELFDRNLRRSSPPSSWTAHTTTAGSSGLFGVDWSGRLLTERKGSIVRLGRVFSPAVSVLEPL